MKNSLVILAVAAWGAGSALVGCAALRPTNAAVVNQAPANIGSEKIAMAPAALRGYGQVTASFTATRAEFECETADYADRLMGKLLADAFWEAGANHIQTTARAGKVSIPLHQRAGYGVLSVARNGNRVVVLGGETPTDVVALATKEPLFQQAGTIFAPAKPYPIYLDFYDLRAVKFYTGAMDGGELGLESHWPFLQKFGLGGLTVQGPSANFNNPASGVVQWAPYDYEVRQAQRSGGMIVPSLYLGGEVSLWDYNDRPFSMMQPSPTALVGAWGYGAATAGAHYLSWGLSGAADNIAPTQFARQVVARYGDNPAVGGWHLYAGSPGVEMAFHDRVTDLWDYSVAGERGFRQWLRDEKKLTLAELGARWFGDSAHFASWDEVHVPDVRGFTADLAGGALRLGAGWSWKKADGAQSSEAAPPGAGKPWIPVAMPPAQDQDFLPFGAAFYRDSFDASAWMRGKTDQKIYLAIDTNDRSADGTQIWINGQTVGQFKSQPETRQVGVDVTAYLQNGRNELVLRVPSGRDIHRDGKLFGPVALSTTPPRIYPFLGREANARWVDVREWQAYGIYHSHLLAAQTARAADPNRPLILSGTAAELGNYNQDLAVRFGMGLQFTGREAYYFPWSSRAGQIAGFYGTSEPSAPTLDPRDLSRTIGWSLFDGDSNIDLFYHIEQYIGMENKTGWFSKNKPLLQLVGKSLPEPAPMVILRSAQTYLLGSQAPDNWDIGRGELHSAHFDYGYATEREVRNGQINGTPLVFDAGSEFMDAQTLAALEKYVRAGGTFVALHQTGRHSLLAPDTYPISTLTGFKVASGSASGPIRFGADLPIFKGWENDQFDGREGIELDAKTAAPGTVALAKWANGNVAVGMRTLGKGRVITLASTFWRADGARATDFFERLFGAVGIERTARSADTNIWTRKVISKNGQQDWLLAFNNSDNARTAGVSFRTAQRPAQVTDLLTGQSVSFDYQNGMVEIAGVGFDRQGTRAFAARRASLVGGLPFWWAEKLKYWRQTETESGTLPPSSPANNARTLAFDGWKFRRDDAAIGADSAWMQPNFDDAKWQTLPTGPWNLRDENLRDYHGAAAYRARFTLPPTWKGRTITLNLYSFNTPIVYDSGEFFINGQKVTSYQGRPGSQTLNYDVTPLLRDGENILSVKVKGGPKLSGVAGCVWLAPERAFDAQLDLSGSWDMVKGDYLTREKISLPGGGQGKYLEKTVDVPADWSGGETFVHIEVPNGQWMKCVAVNGHPIALNSYLHPFGLRSEINISPYVRAGEPNRIQIWPWNTIPAQGENAQVAEDRFDISRIFLGRAK